MAGKRVEMASNAMLMIHAASSFAGGNAADLDNAAESLRKTDRQMAEIYAARTGRSVDDELNALVTEGDRWFTAAEALAAGYIDAVYDPDAEADADEEIAELAALAMRDGLLHHLPNAMVPNLVGTFRHLVPCSLVCGLSSSSSSFFGASASRNWYVHAIEGLNVSASPWSSAALSSVRLSASSMIEVRPLRAAASSMPGGTPRSCWQTRAMRAASVSAMLL